MTYSFGDSAADAAKLALMAQQAANVAPIEPLKAPTEAEQIARTRAIELANYGEARLSPAAQAEAVARTEASARAAAQTAIDAAQATIARASASKLPLYIGVGAGIAAVIGIVYVAPRPRSSTPTLMVKNRKRKSSRGLRGNGHPVSRGWKGEPCYICGEHMNSPYIYGSEGRVAYPRELPSGESVWACKRCAPKFHDAHTCGTENESGQCALCLEQHVQDEAQCKAQRDQWYAQVALEREEKKRGRERRRGSIQPVPSKGKRRATGRSALYDEQCRVADLTKQAVRIVFGEDHLGEAPDEMGELLDLSIVPAADDRGKWAPAAQAIIYTEHGLPGDYTERGMELWGEVSDELAGYGFYVDPINAAVFAVYPIED